MSDVRDLLPLYALGILAADEVDAVDRAVAADASGALAAELASFHAVTERLITPVAPAPDVMARLMVSAGRSKWERFAARFSHIFDVTIEGARELLGLIERPASWETPVPGVGVVHFAGGPAAATADCGFVRIAPGCRFPWHTHKGEEHSLVLSGRLCEDGKPALTAGEELVHIHGSEHDLFNDGTEDCVFAARATNGIAVRGM